MSYMKHRRMSISSQVDRAQKATERKEGGRFTPKEGENNYFKPRTDMGLWFAFCPSQQWTSSLWDRDEERVVTLENYSYYTYVLHTIKEGRRFSRIICSGGAHRDQPCWGCGILYAHYDWRDAEKERTGIEPKKECAVGRSQQYVFAGVLLEHVAKMQKRDDKGNLVTTRDGKPFMIDVPLVTLKHPDDLAEAKKLKAEGATTFGLSQHYSIGRQVLGQIGDFDKRLKNRCGSCAKFLYASEMKCPECQTHVLADHPSVEDGDYLSDQTLQEAREKVMRCECGYTGLMEPVVQCECGSPIEGSLMDFALRIKATKPTDKDTILNYDDVRPLSYYTEKFPSVVELLEKPLNLPEIFAPTKLGNQTYRIPESLRGDNVSPEPRRKKNAAQFTEDYTLADKDVRGTAQPTDSANDFEA